MKKTTLLFMTFIILLIHVFTSYAEDLTFEDFIYMILPDGSVEIAQYTGSSEDVNIPEEIDNKSVTSIAGGAFTHNEIISQVVIPDSVISIGDHAFGECTALQSVTLSQNLQKIGELVFQGDVLLKSISLPASLLQIGMNPFDRCETLSEIQISDENNYYVTADGVLFDAHQTALISYPSGKQDTSYLIPETVTEIAYAAFSENHYIEEIILPDSVVKINGNPFCGCTSLAVIHISPLNHMFEIYENALFNVQELELIAYLWGSDSDSYSVPKIVRSIAQEAFYKHSELKSIDLPKTLITIKDAAFAESGLTEIKLPDQLVSLGNNTFSHCRDLESVTFPSGLTWIGKYVFYECESLISVKFPKSLSLIDEGAFYHCTALTELVFPESLRLVGDFAFLDCTSVRTIDFPRMLFSIGRGAFFGIEDVTVITEPGTLGEEWAQQNDIAVEHKNVEYLPADFA